MIYVISDTHGNYDGLIKALRKHKIIDKHGNRQLARKHKLISIGDLANCVEKSKQGDIDCLSMVGETIDYMIMGNHEMGYLDSSNTFGGFHWHPEIAHLILD
jgi:calcineurin-like phosphoesterase family protein